MTQEIFEEAIKAIIDGDIEKATEIAKRGLEEGIDPLQLMTDGFIPGINEVGDLFGSGKLFIPGLVKSADAMEKATAIINDAIPSEQETISGKIVELAVRNVVHGLKVKNKDALANPEALELFRDLTELND